MKIVSDFDGTFDKVLPLLRMLPPEDVRVVTGQHPNDWGDTIRHVMDELGPNVTIATYQYREGRFTHSMLEDIARWKASKVYEFGGDIFFDDDLRVLSIVKEYCPDTLRLLVL